MKLTCDRSALVDKLAILARGVSTRSALPVLSGILLQASEGRLDLFSTDMELSIKASLATAIEREGEIVVPARLFTDVVRNLPGGEVVIEAGERLPADLHVRHERGVCDGPRAFRRDADQSRPRRLPRRDAADPHGRAHDHLRRHAEDGH